VVRYLHKVNGEVRDVPEQFPLSCGVYVPGEQQFLSRKFQPDHQRTVILDGIGLFGLLLEGRAGVQYRNISFADARAIACRYLSEGYPPLSDDLLRS